MDFKTGDLVFYVGEPILNPTIWTLIVVNNNGIVNLDEIALIIKNDKILKVSTLYFTKCALEIPQISHKFLRHVV